MDLDLSGMIADIAILIITGVIGFIGNEIKAWLRNSKLNQEYSFYNDKVERVLENAIRYAENMVRVSAGKAVPGYDPGATKMDIAKNYIRVQASDVYEKEGNIESLIERKVSQIFPKEKPV